MIAVILHEAAEEEMADAVLWYEGKEPGLGAALREQIEAAISKIQQRPQAYQLVKGSKVRRRLIEKFPYSVFYIIKEDHLFVISVFHSSRNPMIWRGRVD